MTEKHPSPPDVSIVIVTWNSAAFIADCLASITRRGDAQRREIILVDNGSTDGTADLVRRRFPAVRLTALGGNHGFSPACNLGLRQASGRHALLLNPDARLESDAVGTLCDFLDAHPRVGAAGPRLIDPAGPDNPFAGRGFPSLAEEILRQFGVSRALSRDGLAALRLRSRRISAPCRVPCLSGAALMIPRAVLARTGLLSERIPMYFEDIDLCARIAAAGRELFYVPAAVVTHLDGKSAELHPRRPTLIAMEKGQAPWLYFQVYKGAWQARAFRGVVAVSSLLRVIFFGALALPGIGVRDRRHAWRRQGLRKSMALSAWSLTSQGRFAREVERLFPPLTPPPEAAAAEPAPCKMRRTRP